MSTPTSTELSKVKIIDLVEQYNMTIYDIFQKTDYTVERAYPQVVAFILSLGIAYQIAASYGVSDHVRIIKEKIVEVYADWIEVSGGKLPICDIEDTEYFEQAIAELKYRINKH